MDSRLSQKIRQVSFLLIWMVAFIHGYNENIRFQGQGGGMPSAWLSFSERFISDGICRIAVPLFFMISGYLACESIGNKPAPGSFARLLRKRVFSLLIPYLLVSASGIVLVLLLQLFPFSRPFFNHYALEGSSLQRWLNVLLLNPVPFQLWFIRFLMNYFLIFPILFFAIRYLREMFLIPLFFFWAVPQLYAKIGAVKIGFSLLTFAFCLLSGSDVSTYMPTNKNELEGLFFFAFGMYVSLHRLPVQIKTGKKFILSAMLIWLFWVAYRTALSLEIPARPVEVHYHMIAFTFTGTILFWFFCDWLLAHPSLFSRVQKHAAFAIGIFLFHEPLLTILKKGLIWTLGQEDFSLLISFLVSPPLAIMASLWFSGFLAEKMPAVYRIFTGNRQPLPAPEPS